MLIAKKGFRYILLLSDHVVKGMTGKLQMFSTTLYYDLRHTFSSQYNNNKQLIIE